MRFIGKLFAALVLGLVAAFLGGLFWGLVTLGSPGVGMAVGFGIVAILALTARSVRSAWGRGFLFLAVLSLLAPIVSIAFTGAAGSELVGQLDEQGGSDADQAASKAGAVIGIGLFGGLLTGASAFLGFFFGFVFLIIGGFLVLGGRREVIIVQARQDPRLTTR